MLTFSYIPYATVLHSVEIKAIFFSKCFTNIVIIFRDKVNYFKLRRWQINAIASVWQVMVNIINTDKVKLQYIQGMKCFVEVGPFRKMYRWLDRFYEGMLLTNTKI